MLISSLLYQTKRKNTLAYKGLIDYFFFLSRINCYEVVNAQAPFGGFKMSGIGREL